MTQFNPSADTPSQDEAIAVNQVVKHYGSVVALKDVSLGIADQEFFTLLGPSGCGKTTLLRIIAGFESVTSGSIDLFGEAIAGLPANKRPVNTVFQQYSLFPHMTVAENVSFGLEMQGKDRIYCRERTAQMLELVQLGDFTDRKPGQLSGGQQQRVALARALAPEPKVLLLDEPLSALDLKLRQAMRVELKQIQEETGITFIFVTHDQEEALTMSDRIAVMSNGQLQQVGEASEIYQQPRNRFVADFIGETNLLDATVLESDHAGALCELQSGVRLKCIASDSLSPGQKGTLCIRPERLELVNDTQSHNSDTDSSQLMGVVERLVYLGTDTQIRVRLDIKGSNPGPGNEDNAAPHLLVRQQNGRGNGEPAEVGQPVSLIAERSGIRFLSD